MQTLSSLGLFSFDRLALDKLGSHGLVLRVHLLKGFWDRDHEDIFRSHRNMDIYQSYGVYNTERLMRINAHTDTNTPLTICDRQESWRRAPKLGIRLSPPGTNDDGLSFLVQANARCQMQD
ncbi:uncharacterized protein PV06_08059 [Exophiala oligosperma]|uniref:Uncharacterized protein n=1 Tax=Exophiala oligosperma TaxID=215243 RepID=A0A0D2DV84_9EURO|nr:uncharacterized protein PV06_08059 [Exophiala oligosperma]KIW39444.1 hypothetical protein PV06_08059 [Exophiala oligosperma]